MSEDGAVLKLSLNRLYKMSLLMGDTNHALPNQAIRQMLVSQMIASRLGRNLSVKPIFSMLIDVSHSATPVSHFTFYLVEDVN